MADLTKLADALKGLGEAERALQALKEVGGTLTNDVRKMTTSIESLSKFIQQLKG